MYELTFSTCLYRPVEIISYCNSRATQNNQSCTLFVNYFNEVICEAIELLVTCKLVIYGLKFPVSFPLRKEMWCRGQR